MSRFRVRETDDVYSNWTVADGDYYDTTKYYIDPEGTVGVCCIVYITEAKAQAALDLYLSKQGESTTVVLAKNPEYYGRLKSEQKSIKPTNPKDALAINKAPLSTLPTGPMYEVALAMLEGARKYGRHNYRVMGVSAEVYYNATMGHITAWWEGEDIAPTSGIHHLGKAMACLAVIRDGQMM